MDGQIDLDRRAVTELAVELNVAAGLLDEAVHHAEAKTTARAWPLRGVEGLESAALHLFGHAGAGVGHGEAYVIGRRDIEMLGGIFAIELYALRFDDQPA